jgi:hypothetical protein
MMSEDDVEILKTDRNSFGGSQPERLSEEELVQRLCAAFWCSGRGFAQIPILSQPGWWRVVCKHHAHKLIRAIGDTLYQPEYMEEADEFASRVGAVRSKWVPSLFCDPEVFRCTKCGGRMQVETGGGYAGRRWNHTCP